MNKSEWIDKITDACMKANTYQPYFDSVIDTLAQILESRDKAHEQYVEDGAKPTIVHKNTVGAKNVTKNPMLTIEMDLNAQALSYWRDLGLTPSGLKKIQSESVMKLQTSQSLEKILDGLSDG